MKEGGGGARLFHNPNSELFCNEKVILFLCIFSPIRNLRITEDISPTWPTPYQGYWSSLSLCNSLFLLVFRFLDFCSTLFSPHYPLLNSSIQIIKSPLSNNFTGSLTTNIKYNPSSVLFLVLF